ncbi:conjugal transfer protein TraD [Lysobacter sp. CW239]|uniref:conjugal transfer protein TraD n=1 Tax=Lysobacteraceae TaxID=32033 RepID=UPI00056B65A5|nr:MULTISPECIES: conjugal transfer protein TraD [Lysobacter]QOD91998.1 conjugal transfer protein TraD [Lysobacter sp. CW239]
MSKALHDQIHAATEKLARLKARELLAEQREAAKARDKARREDAHRKIELGGLLIASGVGDYNPAEIIGVMLAYQAQRNEERAEQMKRRGLDHLEARKLIRHNK